MRTQNDLDDQLRLANRVAAGFADSYESRSLLDEIGAQIVASELPPEVGRRRRFSPPIARRGVVLASVIGTLAAGGAAAATAVILSSSTVGAPGFCQTVVSETSEVQFPSGDQAWKNWALLQSVGPPLGATLHQLCDTPTGAHMADDAYPGSFVIPPISEKVQFTVAAFCAWTDEWLTAQSDGDAASASQAASEITEESAAMAATGEELTGSCAPPPSGSHEPSATTATAD